MSAQPSLLDLPQTPKPSLCDKLAAYFEARPNVWIDGMDLARIAGQYAWRSRVSDLRKRGMVIENKQRIIRDHVPNCPAVLAWDIGGACSCLRERRSTQSLYRYVPEGQ